ncbi:hypothetical protein ACIBK9_11770 [Nonomuraea sp. NPDC050227]|uniref:hypothetical protein n=1 Tax=Nonomuraea sp. NPDC050227 TaxID=3364360 RepID=UPI0037A89910
MLTALTSGGELVGRDFDGSAGQRWFLQASDTADSVNEVVLRGSPAPDSRLGAVGRHPVTTARRRQARRSARIRASSTAAAR